MENMIETFTSKQFGEVRITLINNEPWFFATDVCKALEIGNAPMTTSRLDEDERMTINSSDSHSGQRGAGAHGGDEWASGRRQKSGDTCLSEAYQ